MSCEIAAVSSQAIASSRSRAQDAAASAPHVAAAPSHSRGGMGLAMRALAYLALSARLAGAMALAWNSALAASWIGTHGECRRRANAARCSGVVNVCSVERRATAA